MIRESTVVCPTDKGGAIVILDRESYSGEMLRILSDSEPYFVLQSDPTVKYKQELKTPLTNKGHDMGILNRKENIWYPWHRDYQ